MCILNTPTPAYILLRKSSCMNYSNTRVSTQTIESLGSWKAFLWWIVWWWIMPILAFILPCFLHIPNWGISTFWPFFRSQKSPFSHEHNALLTSNDYKFIITSIDNVIKTYHFVWTLSHILHHFFCTIWQNSNIALLLSSLQILFVTIEKREKWEGQCNVVNLSWFSWIYAIRGNGINT